MRNAFRMPDRVGDRNRAALRYAEQGETVDAGSIDHRFKIVHEIFKTDVGDLAIR